MLLQNPLERGIVGFASLTAGVAAFDAISVLLIQRRAIHLKSVHGLHRLLVAEADRDGGTRVHLWRLARLVQSAVSAGTARGA